MTLLDWTVIACYLVGIVGYAALRGRHQLNPQDYYLAGRKIRWWQSGASTMATQLGAISFISAPAFVAIKADGGLKWLCYEFGVPLGLLVVLIVILPILHRGNYISIYEYLERRFDRGTRTLVSLLFQLGRGLATAVSVLAGGLILSTALPLSTTQAILIIGLVTVIYDVLGGIRVVILSDFLQMIIIVLGIGICGATALWLVGWDAAWQSLSPERLEILDFRHWGLGADDQYAFWPMLLGGFFLYASYYGCDQSQVQRELSVRDLQGVRKSLLVNAFGRFPLVLFYCVMGVLVGAVFASSELLQHMGSQMGMTSEGVAGMLDRDPDRMIPIFVLGFLPPGVVGLIFVAILSALMSSLDSAINSLSAVTMQDFYRPYVRPAASDRHYLIASKLLTLFWGIFCVLAAIAFSRAGEATRQTTIVLINAVGSLLYGPILAAFLLGMLTRSVRASGVKGAVCLGILANIILWQFTSISWLWWNVAGFLVAFAGAVVLSSTRVPSSIRLIQSDLVRSPERGLGDWRASYTTVTAYFLVIIVVAYMIQTWA
jgi:SSS family solute:Na+ symporter